MWPWLSYGVLWPSSYQDAKRWGLCGEKGYLRWCWRRLVGRKCFHIFGPLVATFNLFFTALLFQVLETRGGSELHMQVFHCLLLPVHYCLWRVLKKILEVWGNKTDPCRLKWSAFIWMNSRVQKKEMGFYVFGVISIWTIENPGVQPNFFFPSESRLSMKGSFLVVRRKFSYRR